MVLKTSVLSADVVKNYRSVKILKKLRFIEVHFRENWATPERAIALQRWGGLSYIWAVMGGHKGGAS